ncbi:hypothetical protein GCM10017774_37960 [Lentzea cavernae]|uniref:Uncharacterized protein n=1 Tax=Lentzea cavernae TaxID=2020703 RepID=A0ABQ3MG79_9PSEU|nr:hypothetical protein GCM10017774_37960 [Lentzea cavernae]
MGHHVPVFAICSAVATSSRTVEPSRKEGSRASTAAARGNTPAFGEGGRHHGGRRELPAFLVVAARREVDGVARSRHRLGNGRGLRSWHGFGLGFARRVFPAEVLAGTLAATSVSFDLSVFEIFAPLSVGGTVVLSPDTVLDVVELDDLVRAEKYVRAGKQASTC